MTDEIKKELSPELLSAMRDRAWEEHEQAERRFHLILGLGNGGALAVVAGRITEKTSELMTENAAVSVAMMVPSAWLFALGLILAGAVAVQNLARKEARVYTANGLLLTKNFLISVPQFRWHTFVGTHILGLVSAGLWVAGILYPLGVLAKGYFTVGGRFIW